MPRVQVHSAWVSPRVKMAEPWGTETLAEGYKKSDELVSGVVDGAADLLGVAIANWVTVLSLQTVIIGGGITETLGKPYVDRIAASFRANVFPQQCRKCEIRITKLAADSGLLGAALLARDA